MSFLFPSFLWGLLAVLVPLAIHLFNFRRTKRVRFTNVSFLREIETQTSSFRKLKHLLILLCRMLALACLALAFAQPYWVSDEQAGQDGIISLYLDNSYSMQHEENSKRYIDVATGYLDELLGMFRNVTSLQLLTNDFAAEELGLATADKIRDRLTTLELSHQSRTLESVYNRQRRLLDRHPHQGARQLFWISDFQKSTAGELTRLRVDSTDRLYLVPVQAAQVKNVFVDSVWLNTPFVRELQNNILHIRVRNSGNEPVEELVVKLSLDQAQVSTASVTIPPNGTANVPFNFSLKGGGFKKGKISFDDFPVTFDNDYYFVLNASPMIRILHLYEEKSLGNFIETVYSNDSLFQLQSYTVSNLDMGRIATADLVLMNGIKRPAETLMARLSEFVQEGGSLMLIPPVVPEGASYSGFMQRLGISGLHPEENPDGPLLPLEVPDSRLPFFSDVFEESMRSESNVNMPSARSSWRWADSGNTLLRLRNGQAFLSQVTNGQGRVYVLGAGLAPASGNFAQHALFVPVMYKIAAQSVRPQRTDYAFGEQLIEITVPEARPNTVYKLRHNTFEIIPVQRLNGNKLTLELPGSQELEGYTMEAGYYELLADQTGIHELALNHNKAESRMEYHRPNELRELFRGQQHIRVFDQIHDADFMKVFEKQFAGASLWKYFLYAALLFFLIEIGLVRFMKG